MTLHEEQKRVQEAVGRSLSYLQEDPWLTQRVLAHGKGEEPVVKKLSVSMILVIALLIVSMTAALAAGLGLFGKLAQDRNADERLFTLEEEADTLSAVMTTEDGITIDICQVYYEGNRVFISYRLGGNLFSVELYEGEPECSEPWSTEIENFIAAKQLKNDVPELQRLDAWLDGKGQRWGVAYEASLHDGLFLEDGTYLEIIGGDNFIQEDGSIIGWKECKIPKERLADTLTFKAVLFRGRHVMFQDGDTLKSLYERGASTDIPFTIKQNDRFIFLKGAASTGSYQAQVELAAGRIDTRGSVCLKCSADWVKIWKTGENEQNLDIVSDWKLYQGGMPVSGVGTEAISAVDEHTLVFSLTFNQVDGSKRITIVPVYSKTGEHPDEAISIERIIE